MTTAFVANIRHENSCLRQLIDDYVEKLMEWLNN